MTRMPRYSVRNQESGLANRELGCQIALAATARPASQNNQPVTSQLRRAGCRPSHAASVSRARANAASPSNDMTSTAVPAQNATSCRSRMAPRLCSTLSDAVMRSLARTRSGFAPDPPEAGGEPGEREPEAECQAPPGCGVWTSLSSVCGGTKSKAPAFRGLAGPARLPVHFQLDDQELPPKPVRQEAGMCLSSSGRRDRSRRRAVARVGVSRRPVAIGIAAEPDDVAVRVDERLDVEPAGGARRRRVRIGVRPYTIWIVPSVDVDRLDVAARLVGRADSRAEARFLEVRRPRARLRHVLGDARLDVRASVRPSETCARIV